MTSYPPPPSPSPYSSGPPQPVRRRGRTPLMLALIFGVVGIVLIVVGAIVAGTQGLFRRSTTSRG